MPRPRAKLLTEREAEIMAFLWARGQASADEIRAALQGQPHDSTVRTLLRVLEGKGHVQHDVRGKVYIYRPAIARARAQRTAVQNLLTRFFGGQAEHLVLRLLEDEHLSTEELKVLLRSTSKPKGKRLKGDTS